MAGGVAARSAAPGGAEVAAAAGTAEWASARARTSGRDVPVDAEQSERRDVVARPDGSFRATLWTHPVRARRGDGWTPIDTTLRRRPDGSVAPAATETPTVFSGGGRQPLVRLGDRKRGLTVTWPRALPKPVLDGDTATYSDVLPGVDLRMTATDDGFSKVFVVRDRAAAADPALRELRFGVRVDGGELRSDAHGNVGAYGAKGEQLFGMGAPRMWDSTPGVPRESLSTMRVDDGDLVLVPDHALLNDPRTVYPVHIDPVTSRGQVGFTTVLSGSADRGYWGGHAGTLAKVGRCGWDNCAGIGLARSYFVFDVGFFGGRSILDTEFNAFLEHSPSCVARPVGAYSTTRATSATTWNNPPAVVRGLYAHTIAFGYNASCAARWVGFPAPGAVGDGLTRGGGFTTIMLKGENWAGQLDGDEYGWKKFRNNPNLEISYNTKPGVPAMKTVEGKACGVRPNQPYVNPLISNDPSRPRGPKIVASAADPDGGTLKVQFAWNRTGGAELGNTTIDFKTSGSDFTVDIPSQDAGHNANLSVRARGFDGIEWGDWSPWCELTVDRVGPAFPPKVSSGTYPECFLLDGSCPKGGAVGWTGGFQFAPGCEKPAETVCDTDIAGYRYDLQPNPLPYVAAGADGRAAVLVTPPNDLTNRLTVQPVDKAGNIRAEYTYEFWVGTGSPPKGQWRLEGVTETTAVDDSSGNHDGTVPLGGPTAWKNGRYGDALWFSGTNGGFVNTTNGPTVRTEISFSISAWVKLDRLDGEWRTAVSQEGRTLSGFYLQYNGSTRRWNFVAPASDSAGATRRAAVSHQDAVAGRWTHLVGTYDVATKVLQVYVDGVAGTAASHPTPWPSVGTLQLGRARIESGQANYWLGAIDEVRAYDRLLTSAEIHDLATAPATEELFMPFEDGTGTQVSEVSGNYRLGTLGGAGTWTDGVEDPNGVRGKAVRFDGGTATLNTAGPVLRTDSSYTVSAWVRPAPGGPAWQTILSQDGNRTSAFELAYRGDTRRFAFRLTGLDTDAPKPVTVTAPDEAVQDAWVEVAGVYDKARGTAELFVGGESKGSVPVGGTFDATGAFAVGRGKQVGAAATPFTGVVDDVHAWAGARTFGQITGQPPVTRRHTAYTGQIGRFVNVGQFHVVTNGPVPPGSHFEYSYGLPAPAGAANTRTVYSCRRGDTDYFLAHDCLTHTKLGVVGQFYITPPAGVETMALYRCVIGGRTHFVSTDPACEGQTTEFLLGYTRAYNHLIRHVATNHPYDHTTETYQVPPTYRAEGSFGVVSTRPIAGTTALMSCRDGEDVFSSTDPACEGKSVVRRVGYIWTSPPQNVTASGELFRCRTSAGERFDSRDPGCEDRTPERSLGFVVTVL